MKKIITITIILLALAACSAIIWFAIIALTSFQVQTPETSATDNPQVGMSNPASVYCKLNGNTLEIQTAADGSQSGVCVFPDGSTGGLVFLEVAQP